MRSMGILVMILVFLSACNKQERPEPTLETIKVGYPAVSTSLPLVIGGQKGLVEESDLRIPNMRGIMMARQKPLSVVEPMDLSPFLNISKIPILIQFCSVVLSLFPHKNCLCFFS